MATDCRSLTDVSTQAAGLDIVIVGKLLLDLLTMVVMEDVGVCCRDIRTVEKSAKNTHAALKRFMGAMTAYTAYSERRRASEGSSDRERREKVVWLRAERGSNLLQQQVSQDRECFDENSSIHCKLGCSLHGLIIRHARCSRGADIRFDYC